MKLSAASFVWACVWNVKPKRIGLIDKITAYTNPYLFSVILRWRSLLGRESFISLFWINFSASLVSTWPNVSFTVQELVKFHRPVMTSEIFRNLLLFFRGFIPQQPCSNQWHDSIYFLASCRCLQFCKSSFLNTRVNWTFGSQLHYIFIFSVNSCHVEPSKNGGPLLKWTLGSTPRCKRGVSIISSKS